jgi:hypothetical protein
MANIFRIIPIVLFTFLAASCSSTSPDFTAYKDSTVFLGHGGVNRSIDGIEFWMDGSPDRKFRIIGVVSMKQEKGHSIPLPGMLNQLSQLPQMAQSSPESHLASEAKAHGGDAVIIIQPTHHKSDDSSNGLDFDNAAFEGGFRMAGRYPNTAISRKLTSLYMRMKVIGPFIEFLN